MLPANLGHDYNDEDDEEGNDEVENDDDEYDDQMRALQLPVFTPNYDYNDEDDEIENDDDEYDDQMRVLQLPILRILLKQDTALLSNVSQLVSPSQA